LIPQDSGTTAIAVTRSAHEQRGAYSDDDYQRAADQELLQVGSIHRG
jgi:hypothetical protein